MRGAGRDALGDQFAQVRLEAMPNQYDGQAQLALQVTEEVRHIGGVHVGVRMQSEIQRDAIAPRHNALCGYGRDHPVRSGASAPQRGVPAWTPELTCERIYAPPRFVQENR